MDVPDHFHDLDETKVIGIPPNQQNSIDIVQLLRK